jgi:hypothetical protein
LAFDEASNLYIADSNNHRIRRVNVAATVQVDPDTLSVKSDGKWVTIYIQFPLSRNPADVKVDTVTLQAIDPVTAATLIDPVAKRVLGLDRPAEGAPTQIFDGILMLKYDASTVRSWGEPRSDLHLRVEGQFFPPMGSKVGRYFSGDAVILVR